MQIVTCEARRVAILGVLFSNVVEQVYAIRAGRWWRRTAAVCFVPLTLLLLANIIMTFIITAFRTVRLTFVAGPLRTAVLGPFVPGRSDTIKKRFEIVALAITTVVLINDSIMVLVSGQLAVDWCRRTAFVVVVVAISTLTGVRGLGTVTL
jgi:hypothetical protein